MDAELRTLEQLIKAGETLEIEFKSDRSGSQGQQMLDDNTIIEEVVALANTLGGFLLIGVENDGTVTGLNSRRKDISPQSLQSFIYNHTRPSIQTKVALLDYSDCKVLIVRVECQPGIIYATASGKMLKRHMAVHGPETCPLYPFEVASRLTSQRQLDYSAQVLYSLDWSAIDPLEMERIRQTIQRNTGKSDAALVGLDDVELAKSLGIVVSDGNQLRPTIAGLLVAGREQYIRQIIPTHQIHFQVINEQDNVRVNDSFRLPLIAAMGEIERRFAAHNQEQEVLIGMFRVAIPDYSPHGFREAINNAVVHRDYAMLGEVFIQWRPDHILITNPGGLMQGITLENIIYHEPLPRNPLLADILKRVGLVERTARGVDMIYQGQLRFGRPAPDYSRTDFYGVRVVLPGGRPLLEFVRLVYEEEKQLGKPLPLDQLMALNHLFFSRRTDTATLAKMIYRDEFYARSILERLVERGLVVASGQKKARVYHLSARVYAASGHPEEYVRVKGFDNIQQETMVLQYIDAHGKITRKDASALCQITLPSAYHLLSGMASKGLLQLVGKGKYAYYIRSGKSQ